MTSINYAKDKLLDLQLKISPKQRKIWRNIPATTVEIKQAYIDSMEKCTGKTHAQILEGTAEDYSYARRMMVEKNDLMEVLGIGPSALAYQKTRLDPIRLPNGEIDYSKVEAKYQELCIDPDIISTIYKGIKNKYPDQKIIESDLIERKDYLQYFPTATRVYEIKGTNIIYINADFINISAHFPDYVGAYDCDNFWQFQKENMMLTKNTTQVYEQILEYRKRCGYEELDIVKFSEWLHSTRNSWRNHYYAITDLTVGGQFYINECIDLIEDRQLREKFKNCEFTTHKVNVNPLTDFWEPSLTRAVYVKYIENIEYQMHVEYEDQHIRSMREDGILK